MNKYRFSFIDKDGGGNVYRLQYDVDGWKNFGISFGRMDGFSNIVKSYTESWVFIGDDGEYLKRHFFKYGVNGKVQLIVEERINQIRDDYKVIFVGWIDFPFIKFDSVVSVPVKSGGFYSALENQMNKDFEFDMDCRIENFEGLKVVENCLYNSGRYDVVGRQPKDFGYYIAIVGLDFKNKEKDTAMFKEVKWELIDGENTPINIDKSFFAVNTSLIDEFRVSWDFDIVTTISDAGATKYEYTLKLLEFEYNDSDNFDYNNPVRSWRLNTSLLRNVDFYGSGVSMRYKTKGVHTVLRSGNKGKMYFLVIYLSLHNYYLTPNSKITISISSFNFGSIAEYTLNSNKNLQAIRSIDVFKGLINKINNSRYNVRINTDVLEGFINSTNRNKYDLLTNGSGLRGYPIELTEEVKRVMEIIGVKLGGEYEFTPAKFSTTLSKFLEFIHVVYGLRFDLSYNVETDIYTVNVTTFEDGLNSDIIARLTNVNEVSFEPASEFAFTNVQVGYTPKEDSLFGKLEYNNTLDFKTMYNNIDESTLSLVSPYSAAVFDIETFIYNNYQKFQDSENRDDENYIIVCSQDQRTQRNTFKLRRKRTVDGDLTFPNTAWNTDITPKTILNNHGIFFNSIFAFHRSKQMMFSLSKRNSGIIVDGIPENGAITIGSEKKFIPLLVTFNAPATGELLEAINRNKNGLIEFVYNGKTYAGWLWGQDAITINPMNEKESSFSLILNKYE